MEKVRPWCGHPLDRGRLKNTTEIRPTVDYTAAVLSRLYGYVDHQSTPSLLQLRYDSRYH